MRVLRKLCVNVTPRERQRIFFLLCARVSFDSTPTTTYCTTTCEKTHQLSNLISSSGFFVLLSAFIRNACGYSESTCSNWLEVPSTKNVAVSICYVCVVLVGGTGRLDARDTSAGNNIIWYTKTTTACVRVECVRLRSAVAMMLTTLCCRHAPSSHNSRRSTVSWRTYVN